METFMIDAITKRRKGYLRYGTVKVLPIRRSSDWLQENSDSAFMNSGAKVEYVVPRNQRSGQLFDPLADLKDEEKERVAKELGFKDGMSLNIMRQPEKENYWINRPVILDKNGKFLDLQNVADFVAYKILEVNYELIAPSWEERYEKGTYKFALVFEEEEAKIKNMKFDTKKDAYISFGKIDGSIKKLSDFLWIYYLTNKDGKRIPNNPTLEYLRGEVGRIIEEKPGSFMAIITDPLFETKALIQKAINIGLIQKEGMTFKIFNDETSKNTLEGLIAYLLDERNNNQRIALIGRIEANEAELHQPIVVKETDNLQSDIDKRMKQIEDMTKKAIEENEKLMIANQELMKINKELETKTGKDEKKEEVRKGKQKKVTDSEDFNIEKIE